jgi:hypothetical protein
LARTVATAPHHFPPLEPSRVSLPAELDALVGSHITGETPETYWEDCHGHFQFDTEEEARMALSDPYYQRFLPDVDWTQTVIRQVTVFRPYCSDAVMNWRVVEKATAQFGVMKVWRENSRWHAAFGTNDAASARTPAVAICLAALSASGVLVDVNHDRLDAQISQLGIVAAEKGDALRRNEIM